MSFGLSLALLRPLAQVIGRIGGEPSPFLAELGVTADTPDDAYIDANVVDAAFDAIAASRGDPTFGLTLARTAVRFPLGFFDHLVWPGATVRDALLRSEKFYALFTRRSHLTLEERDGVATITQHVEPSAPRGTVLTELAFASVVLRARSAAGTLEVQDVSLVHAAPSPDALATYAGIFEAPVRFAQPVDALRLPTSALDRPLASADPIAAAALEAHAVRMRDALEEDPFARDARRAIEETLRETANGLAVLARELGLSERTVQRRLQERGTSHRELVDEVRADVAKRRLRDGASTTEVAYELGFASPQAFNKAFSRWTGLTPGAFRSQR